MMKHISHICNGITSYYIKLAPIIIICIGVYTLSQQDITCPLSLAMCILNVISACARAIILPILIEYGIRRVFRILNIDSGICTQ